MPSFTIWLTNKCNLACSYCYEKNNVNRVANEEVIDIETIVAFIKGKADQYKENDILISFHGGEPLLEYNRIKEYVECLESGFRNRGLFFFMTTNGLLLNKEKAEYLMNHLAELSVSIDGCREAHDLNRVFSNGRGSYQEIIQNIEQSGLDKSKLRIRMTVTANNVEYLASGVDNLVVQGFRCIVPAVALEDPEWTEERLMILENELIRIKKKYYGKNIRIAMIDRKEMQKKGQCSGGITSFNIMKNGDVYPCEFVAGNKSFLLGNITDIHIDELELRRLYGHDACKDCTECTYKMYCKGVRCKYINKSTNGDFNTPSDIACMVENIKYRIYNYIP
jgi:uncharacterized protein